MSLPLLAFTFGAALATSGAACTTSAPSPFPAVGGGGAGGGEAGGGGEGASADPTLGGPCVDDGQCDDAIDCTFDACDQTVKRCRFTPDDILCQNDVYCDGVERCNPNLGCTPGEPIGCSDATPCTIDACDEAAKRCVDTVRDADLDGDPDARCGGDDCDDTDPAISGAEPEVCENGRDDNCDRQVDETGCVAPQHDTCADPLEISTTGAYAMTTAGAGFHYASSCNPDGPAGLRDVVAAIVLPPGPPLDVEVTARSPVPDVAVTLAGQCGNAASELACGGPFAAPDGGSIAKLRGRAVGDPAQPTTLPLYVTTASGTPVTVDVAFLPPIPLAENETCGTAELIAAGVPVEAVILDAAKDLASACETELGELVYTFDLDAPADVDLFAISTDGDGLPAVSLRSAACALPADEITCQVAAEAHVFRRAVPAGTYAIGVSASAPTTVLLTLEVSPPTTPPADEDCASAQPIAPNTTVAVSLDGHQDDVDLDCGPAAPDAVYTLDLPVASDVLLIERLSSGDTGAIQLVSPACGASSDVLACGTDTVSPLRAPRRNVPAGSYRVVAEAELGQPVSVTALTRPAVPPTVVPFADGCDDVLEIPADGGFFQGNTANARADFNAGCDLGGTEELGAADQLLKLTLPARKRVVLDMNGSGYPTMLDVRRGPSCPGTEVTLGCTIGVNPQNSFLDLTLDAGVYFIQIDGYAMAQGAWFLDVRVVDP